MSRIDKNDFTDRLHVTSTLNGIDLSDMATIREEIIGLLGQEECDARIISQSLGISEKAVYDHLPHIIQTLSSQGKKLKIIPACCISCGFAFKDRKRPNRPSRCPKCKNERIDPPKFKIK